MLTILSQSFGNFCDTFNGDRLTSDLSSVHTYLITCPFMNTT